MPWGRVASGRVGLFVAGERDGAVGCVWMDELRHAMPSDRPTTTGVRAAAALVMRAGE